ncbi:MAG: type II secretion system F family protein [Vulcanimicrobiota bacterium]
MSELVESAHLARDLHLLMQSGMPVPEALARVQARSKGSWAESLRRARDAAAAGAPLAEALRKSERLPRLLVEGLEGAEQEPPLMRLSQLLLKADWRQRQTQVVLAYPLMLLLAGTSLFLLLWATLGHSLPQLYGDLSLKLPLPTRISLGFLAVAGNPLVLLALGLSIAGLAWILAGKTASSAALRLRLPLAGSWLRRSEAANWLDWTDYYLANQRPAPEALRRAARACQDRAFRMRAEAAGEAAEKGQDLGSALTQSGLLPDLTLWLVAQAEAREFPPGSLAQISEVINRELETEAEGGLACLEVAAILLIAVLLVPMIISFFIPLYQLIGNL